MRKPKFTKFTDKDLDNLSQITEQDILAAHRRILQAVDRRFKNLVLAVRERLFEDDTE